MAENEKMQEMQEMQETQNEPRALSEQEMQEIAAGGKHLDDGRLIVCDLYSCKYFERIPDDYVIWVWCGHCKYRTTSHGWIVCDHPGNRR